MVATTRDAVKADACASWGPGSIPVPTPSPLIESTPSPVPSAPSSPEPVATVVGPVLDEKTTAKLQKIIDNQVANKRVAGLQVAVRLADGQTCWIPETAAEIVVLR